MQHVDVWGRDLGDESRGVSEAASHREPQRRMLRMIFGVTLKDMVESTVIASRVKVDDLEEHLRQQRLRWFASRDEEVEIKKVFELKIEGQRKIGRPVKRWIDVLEEDMKKRGVMQQNAGGREGGEW